MNKDTLKGFAAREQIQFLLPAAIVSLLVIGALLFEVSASGNGAVRSSNLVLIFFGAFASIYIGAYYLIIIPVPHLRHRFRWHNALISSFSLGILIQLLPAELRFYFELLLILTSISITFSSGRLPAYLLLLITTSFNIIGMGSPPDTIISWILNLRPTIISFVIVETIVQLIATTQQHIERLETINEFSRRISSSLNPEEVYALLKEAIKNAMDADTYFVGIQENNQVNIIFMEDQDELFKDIKVNLENSLAGWILKNRTGLFLTDLRRDLPDNIKSISIGKNKKSLSWIGVPMQANNINGLIALSSYSPNAFDRTDFELLTTLAHQAAQSLDNANHHSVVERQSQLDSLTGVYNHGHFIKLLQKEARVTTEKTSVMSLIMLDIDYFKQYNDTYGHLAGDQILQALSKTIQRYVKATDLVGRWGGEEFVIALPNTSGPQAIQVAERIRKTMGTQRLILIDEKTVPSPTISQGIAIFPNEADEIYKLIDLADQRLYTAKERGRNQIEPDGSHWEELEYPQC